VVAEAVAIKALEGTDQALLVVLVVLGGELLPLPLLRPMEFLTVELVGLMVHPHQVGQRSGGVLAVELFEEMGLVTLCLEEEEVLVVIMLGLLSEQVAYHYSVEQAEILMLLELPPAAAAAAAAAALAENAVSVSIHCRGQYELLSDNRERSCGQCF
jgi:hypothetical protein